MSLCTLTVCMSTCKISTFRVWEIDEPYFVVYVMGQKYLSVHDMLVCVLAGWELLLCM